jgi:hypothetical protein
MDSLKDLIAFLKTRENGASMGELKEVFSDEVTLKAFIKSGLELEMIVKEGEKRGTRYYAAGLKVSNKPVEKKNKKEKKNSKEEAEESYENTLDHKDMDIYLNSDKPINGMGVFSKLVKFGEYKTDNKKFINFLNCGSILKQSYVMYSKIEKKNLIIEEHEYKQINKIALRREGRKFFIIYFGTDKREEEEFSNYEDFREFLLSKL